MRTLGLNSVGLLVRRRLRKKYPRLSGAILNDVTLMIARLFSILEDADGKIVNIDVRVRAGVVNFTATRIAMRHGHRLTWARRKHIAGNAAETAKMIFMPTLKPIITFITTSSLS